MSDFEQQIEDAYAAYINRVIDTTFDGRPIPYKAVFGESITERLTFRDAWKAGYEFGYMKGACDEHNS